MILKQIPVGIYAVNCYIIACEDTKKAAVIDPGGNGESILNYINMHDLVLTYVILTHAHGDHIGGLIKIKEQIDVPILLHKDDASMLEDSNKNLSNLMSGPSIEMPADRLLEDNEIIELGNLKLHIIHTPGHTPGGICIQVEEMLFTGDTLFAGSIGRTDFEGGSFEQLITSIKQKLIIFDEDTKIFPGHGPTSSIGVEKKTNPFIRL